MMLFKTWGYITMTQALQFTSDFKLGHYMKIPHRPMFWCQIVATVVAGTVQLGVQAWMFSNIEDLCSADQPNGFVCPSTTVFGTASIIASHCCFRCLSAYSKLVCHSGVSSDRNVCSRTVTSTTVSLSFSWLAQSHPSSNGHYTKSSDSISSSTSISRSSLRARATCLLRHLSTMYPGSSFATSLII